MSLTPQMLEQFPCQNRATLNQQLNVMDPSPVDDFFMLSAILFQLSSRFGTAEAVSGRSQIYARIGSETAQNSGFIFGNSQRAAEWGPAGATEPLAPVLS